MLPWGHLAVGYLAFTLLSDRLDGRPQTAAALVAVAAGTQLPDAVDKPLAWYLHVLPSGRSLGHSIFVAVLLSGLAYAVARRLDRPLVGVAFAVGYLTHLAGDALYPLLRGEWVELGFVFWPVWTYPYTDTDYTILEMLISGATSPTGLFEIGLFVVAVGVWVRRETPGLGVLRARWEQG